jgi:hypothetical protein
MSTPDSPDLESIMRRVRKLLAIAEDSRGDPNECAAAAQQAERIMRKYQIDHADAILSGFAAGGDFAGFTTGYGENPFAPGEAFSRPCSTIAVAVANLYDCVAQPNPDNPAMRRFAGFRIDAILARYTYLMLVNSMVATADLWKQRNRASKAQRGDYLAGYASAVCAALRKAREAKDAETRAEAASYGALVVAKGALVRQHFGDPAYSTGRGAPASAAAAAGYAAGSRVDVGSRGIERGAAQARIGG